MKQDRINYQKTFNLGNYCSERIGMEAQLDEGDNPEFELHNLKKMVEDLHKKTNPGLYIDAQGSEGRGEFVNALSQTGIIKSPPPIPSLDYKAKERVEILIENAVDLKELENYKESAAEYGLTTQYMDNLKSLTSGKWDKEIKPKLS